VQCQKISLTTPRNVNGNPNGERGFKSQNILTQSVELTWNFQGAEWRGWNYKNHRRAMDIF